MTAQTATIADFLLARYEEDEAVTAVGYESRAYWEGAVAQRSLRPESVAHYERHDPARVLAECEAKRRIVERETERARRIWRLRVDEHRRTWEQWQAEWPPGTLRDLALPYADHPDFREEWRA